MPGMPSLWMACCCFGEISRFSQTKPLRVDRRSRVSIGVEVGQRAGEKLDRLVLVDDAARLGKQAGRLDVGGENLAVAVDDVGPCGGDRVLRRGAARDVAVGADREHDEPPADHGIDRGKGEDGEADAGARLDVAVDIAPVEQAADQPLPPGFSRLVGTPAHRCAPCAGTEPVTIVASPVASMMLSIEPIGSGSLVKFGGRSGKFFN